MIDIIFKISKISKTYDENKILSTCEEFKKILKLTKNNQLISHINKMKKQIGRRGKIVLKKNKFINKFINKFVNIYVIIHI